MTINNRTHQEDIYAMRNQHQNLNPVSKTAIQALQLLKTTPSVHAVEPDGNFRKEFSTLFTGLGLLDSHKIRLRQDTIPVCLYTHRRVAYPLLPQVKKQLQALLQSGVISQVTEPTERCSGMVVVPKSSGDLRVCVNLTPLKNQSCSL